MSPKERELLDRIKEVQAHLRERTGASGGGRGGADRPHATSAAAAGGAADDEAPASSASVKEAPRVRESAGAALSEHDGRCGFLLAFGAAIPLTGVGEKKEDVAVLFGGTREAPLLVQRIGKGREEAAATSDGPQKGTSGAAAAPQLGYVTKREVTSEMDARQAEMARADAALFDAAMTEAAALWKGGRRRALAVPPRGLQWSLGAPQGEEEATEAAVTLEATYDRKKGTWAFAIAGRPVEPLDARAVLSPCSAPSEVAALAAGSDVQLLLQRAFYAFPCKKTDGSDPWAQADGGPAVASRLKLTTGLELFARLHGLAASARRKGAREGLVYDWAGLAACGSLSFGAWRDALLAITTRDADHVILGPVQADGTGTGRDMTEGPLYRILHALECLYPATLVKEGALKWRVVPRGAAYHHLLTELERLGRGAVEAAPLASRFFALQPPPDEADASADAVDEPDADMEDASAGGVEKAPRPRKVGASNASSASMTESKYLTADGGAAGASSKAGRPKRKAGEAAKAAAAATANAEAGGSSGASRRAGASDGATESQNHAGTAVGAPSTEQAMGTTIVKEQLDLPRITSKLWPHQQRSVEATLTGVRAGKLGFADASTVGAGKTLTALATVVDLARHMEATGQSRHGVLIMLPEPNLIKEWLLELGKHTSGFHVVEQRNDGQLFSITYAKAHPPIDANTIVLSTLDRVATHPFIRQVAWDFVVIDECLAVQNAAAKRCPSAWRQIEVSTCGVLMLSATFFRSSYASLFYMIRMLRSPLPRTLEFLPALIHEHIVCEVPETDRTWKMHGEAVPLTDASMSQYRKMIDQFERRRLNYGDADGMKLWGDLASFLRGPSWEGRGGEAGAHYGVSSPLAEAFVAQAKKMVKAGSRPLVFANTEEEKSHLLTVMRAQGLDALAWSDVQNANLRMGGSKGGKAGRVIVANKGTEGHGSNMQRDADAIICRPTAGDALEQMKGRVDRPGQATKELVLVVIYAANTIEEAEYANIRLAGNFFRQYIAPVARRYKEAIDLEGVLAAGGNGRLRKGAVREAWHKCYEQRASTADATLALADIAGGDSGEDGEDARLDEAAGGVVATDEGGGGTTASDDKRGSSSRGGGAGSSGAVPGKRKKSAMAEEYDCDWWDDEDEEMAVKEEEEEEEKMPKGKRGGGKGKKAAKGGKSKGAAAKEEEEEGEDESYTTINTVKRNRGDPVAVRAAKQAAKEGRASAAVQRWLFPPPESKVKTAERKGIVGKGAFSTTTPPLVLDRPTIEKAIAHLSSHDPKIASLINRVGKDALFQNFGEVLPPTRERFFDKVLKGITFSMISVAAGETMLRKLAIKCGCILEHMPPAARESNLTAILGELRHSGECDEANVRDEAHLLELLLAGNFRPFVFTPLMVGVVCDACSSHGQPHLAGSSDGSYIKVSAGKNDDPQVFLEACRKQMAGGPKTCCGFSAGNPKQRSGKAPFIIDTVEMFRTPGVVPDISTLSDAEAAKLLHEFPGVGDWVCGRVLQELLRRADVMLYGDLTIRNYLNELYDIGHVAGSETHIDSAADFNDTPHNRNLMDAVAERNGWAPYRTVVCLLMYFLQEDNLVLL